MFINWEDSILLRYHFWPYRSIGSMKSVSKIDKLVLKCKCKQPKLVKPTVKKKKTWGLALSGFQICCITKVTKTVWRWDQDRYTGTWNGI